MDKPTDPSVPGARITRLENINQSLAMRIADLESQIRNLRDRLDKLADDGSYGKGKG